MDLGHTAKSKDADSEMAKAMQQFKQKNRMAYQSVQKDFVPAAVGACSFLAMCGN
jgi:hypothetical protein